MKDSDKTNLLGALLIALTFAFCLFARAVYADYATRHPYSHSLSDFLGRPIPVVKDRY